MADRLLELSENDSTSLADRKNSENPKKGTKVALNASREYLKQRKVNEEALVSSMRRTSWRMHIQLISTGSCCASWVENSGELAPIPLLKIHARIKWCLFVYNVPTDEF